MGLGITQGTVLSGYKCAPMKFAVGKVIDDGSVTPFDDISNLPKVTKIEFGDLYHGMEMPKQEGAYFVYTSDGHIRVLPADKYIAEWSE